MISRSQPLAEQVRRQILHWIQSNRDQARGGSLPSETELAAMFAASRATVREALAQLERERLVIRRQGSGTYVSLAFNRLMSTLNELNDPLRLIEQQGQTAAIFGVEHVLAQAGPKTAEMLMIEPGAELLSLRVVYLGGVERVACLEAEIPLDTAWNSNTIPDFARLVPFARQVSGWAATHSIATLRAVAASEDVAKSLAVAVGQPLLAMHELYLTDSGRPAFQSTLFFPTGRLSLEVLRNSTQSPAQVVIW